MTEPLETTPGAPAPDPVQMLPQEIAAAKAHYLAIVDTAPRAAVAAASARVVALQQTLGELIARGADPCPCGGTVWGLKKRPGLFEVGCLSCPERARGETPAEAVARWNAGSDARQTAPAEG